MSLAYYTQVVSLLKLVIFEDRKLLDHHSSNAFYSNTVSGRKTSLVYAWSVVVKSLPGGDLATAI